MKLAQAKEIAESLVEQMRPYCEKIAVAGSIRREKPEVKDLEIVAIPKWDTIINRVGLFEEEVPEHRNRLFEWAYNQTDVMWIKTGTQEITPWKVEPDGKMWKGYLSAHSLKLDLFLCDVETWGYIFMLRTGSDDFNRAVAPHALKIGTSYTVEAMRGCATEDEVFERLQLATIPPQARSDGRCLRRRMR